jgi:hypothetical protein
MILETTGQTSSFRERRASPRVSVGREVQAGLATIGEAIRVVEVGFGGFSALVSTPLETGSIHEFRFRVASGFAVALQGEVRYSLRMNSPGRVRYLVGVEFARQQRPEVRRTIDRLIDEATATLSFV